MGTGTGPRTVAGAAATSVAEGPVRPDPRAS